MHFFTEPNLLNTQSTSDVFGPDPSDADNKYNISSKHSVSGVAKIFACQNAMMLVRPCIDSTGTPSSTLVNIILKPISSLVIPFTDVKYYIYRGIDRSSLIVNVPVDPQHPNGIAIAPTTGTPTQFISKFWKKWTDFKTNTNQPALDNPLPLSFGYDTATVGTTLVEELFNSAASTNTTINDFQAIRVSEGEWIANLQPSVAFEFEIITDTDNLEVNLDYVQKVKQIVDATGLGGYLHPSTLAEIAKRDLILNYVDPAAFFGMHFETGLKIFSSYNTSTFQTITSLIKSNTLVNDVMNKFLNKDVVYLDLRSERGYSYYYYQNYHVDAFSGTILQWSEAIRLKSESQTSFHFLDYAGLYWPLINLKNPSFGLHPLVDGDKIELKILVQDNINPLLFVQNKKLLGSANTEHFVKEDRLLDSGTSLPQEYSLPIKLEVPFVQTGSVITNVAHHIKIYYLRQKYNSTMPTGVLKSDLELDSIFGGIHCPEMNTANAFRTIHQSKYSFVRNSAFAYLANTGLYYNSSGVLFFAKKAYALLETANAFPNTDYNAGDLNSLIPEEYVFSKSQITEGAQTIDVLQLNSMNRISERPPLKEDYFFIGLTKTELDSLDGLTAQGIDNLHHKYFIFEKQTVAAGTYSKYKVKIQGFDANKLVKTDAPAIDIFVYGLNDHTLCSKDFAATINLPVVLPDPSSYTTESHAGFVTILAGDIGGVTEFTVDDYDNNNISTSSIQVELNSRVFFPATSPGVSNIANIKPGAFPLIVLIHGNGHFYDHTRGRVPNYDHLLTHLARNGFIAVSVDVANYFEDTVDVTPHPTMANTYLFILNYTQYIYNSITSVLRRYDRRTNSWVPTPLPSGYTFDSNTSPTRLTSVLRSFDSGLGALGRANIFFKHLELLKNRFATTNGGSSSLNGQVGLIGHSRGGEAILTAKRLLPSQPAVISSFFTIQTLFSLAPTDQYHIEELIGIPHFVLYGSKDGDLSSAWIHHDRPYPPPSMVTEPSFVSGTGFSLWDRSTGQEKAMAFVKGATHNGFVTLNSSDYRARDLADYVAPESIQRNMLAAFANAFFRTYLLSENRWKPVLRGMYVPPSIRDANTPINFRHSGFTAANTYYNTTEDLNFAAGQATAILKLRAIDNYSPHGMSATILDLSISNIFNAFQNLPINASAFNYLAFQMAKVYDHVPDLRSFAIEINGISYTVGDVVNAPDFRFDDVGYTKSDMQSIIVPLDAFTGLNKANISSINLAFGTNTGRVAFNGFEFTS